MILPNQASGLLPRPAAAPTAPAVPADTPWVAVTGAKGGVGKTLLAVNLAVLMQKAGRRVLLVDLDPGLGNVDVHLRLSPALTLEDAALGHCTVQDAIIDGPAGLKVLAGRSGSPRLSSGDPGFLADVLATVREAGVGFDVVLCDTGAGIGPSVLAVAERADLVLGVTAAEPAAVTDTYALCKLLAARGRPLPRLVVNRVRSRDEALRTAGKLATVCRKFLAAECQLLGWLLRDGALEQSVVAQRPFALSGMGPVLEDLRGLGAAVLSELPARGVVAKVVRPVSASVGTVAPAVRLRR